MVVVGFAITVVRVLEDNVGKLQKTLPLFDREAGDWPQCGTCKTWMHEPCAEEFAVSEMTILFVANLISFAISHNVVLPFALNVRSIL